MQKKTLVENDSQVILIKDGVKEIVQAPKKICFKEFAYPQLNVTMIELLNLDGEFAVLVDEEGLFNDWNTEHILYKENQVVAQFMGNGMIVDISEYGEINSLTNERAEEFNSIYELK